MMNFKMEVGHFYVEDLVNLIEQFKISVISPHVLHAFDVAKLSSAIYSRIKGVDGSVYMYLAGLFHDAGLVVFSDIKKAYRRKENEELDEKVTLNGISFNLDDYLIRFDKEMVHSKVSYIMIKRTNILPKEFLKAVLHHHTPLDDIDESDEIVLLSNIINVADDISKLYRRESSRSFEALLRVFEEVRERMDILDDVRSALYDLSKDLVTVRYALDDKPHYDLFASRSPKIWFDQMEEFLKMLSLFIDLRSPYTLKHSSAIAILSRDLTMEVLKSPFDAKILYMAGLVHDIGKLRTPLEILHKHGKLSIYEMYTMKMHVVDTFKMLRGLRGFEEISAIASLHHERLDGSGYPFGYTEKDLGMRSRVLQVADVFEALMEDRPYREGMDSKEALKIIRYLVSEGKLDSYVYEKLSEMVKNGYRPKKNFLVLFEFFEEVREIDPISRILKSL